MKRFVAFNSFVFINVVSDEILMYNTIDKSMLIIDSKIVYNLFLSLNKEDTSKYYIEFDESLLDNCDFKLFLKELELKNMGELLSLDINNVPVFFSPMLSIGKHNHIIYSELMNSDIVDDKFDLERKNVLGNKILNNLKEITVYVNSLPNEYNLYKNSSRFYLFPVLDYKETINFSRLLEFVDYSYLHKIRLNLVIGHFSEYIIKEINDFILFVDDQFEIFIYTLYQNDSSVEKLNISSDRILLWVLPFSVLFVNSNYKYIGLFSNEIELDYYIKNDSNFLYYYPYFTGCNKEFCVDQLKFNLDDLLAQELDEVSVFSRKLINSNFYGRLSILPNGEIFSCFNRNLLGNILIDMMKNIVLKEMMDNRNWFFTRKHVDSCSNCKYNILCPPISDFEIFMNFFAFCEFK